tara:strand:- start:4778 stop:5083 length:306 start_codon:yes stop_codon:yes gene_type:complete
MKNTTNSLAEFSAIFDSAEDLAKVTVLLEFLKGASEFLCQSTSRKEILPFKDTQLVKNKFQNLGILINEMIERNMLDRDSSSVESVDCEQEDICTNPIELE